MNVQETMALIAALRNAGATHFKSQDFEVSLNLHTTQSVSVPVETLASVAAQPAPSVENPQATEKIKELINTLKMDDSQLLDKIFPAGAGG